MKKGQLLDKPRYKVTEKDGSGNVVKIVFYPSQAAIANAYLMSRLTLNKIMQGIIQPENAHHLCVRRMQNVQIVRVC